VLIVWPAIVGVLAVISIPFIWGFRVIRASARSDEGEPDAKPDSADTGEEKAPESEPAAG
jgi:hypothetical protein